MPVLAWATGDRENLAAQIGADQIVRFPRHLDAIGEHESIALLLYTRGGDTNVPWPVVNFIRAYSKSLTVLVPFCAHSAGTLVALGADRVLMTRIGTLSPIDPSVANAFNPQDQVNPQNRIPIAVEDVLAYFELARSQGVKRDEDLAESFHRLADAVHPLALGNVHRSIAQISQLAEKLIRLHSPNDDADEVTDRIRRLTTAFYTHNHLINRQEARDLGLPVEEPSESVEKQMLAYYAELIRDLELRSKFDPASILSQQAQQEASGIVLERAYIETKESADVFLSEGVISMQQQILQGMPPQAQPPALPQIATFEVTSEEWREPE